MLLVEPVQFFIYFIIIIKKIKIWVYICLPAILGQTHLFHLTSVIYLLIIFSVHLGGTCDFSFAAFYYIHFHIQYNIQLFI